VCFWRRQAVKGEAGKTELEVTAEQEKEQKGESVLELVEEAGWERKSGSEPTTGRISLWATVKSVMWI
jgi:hypothetical protein